MSEGRILLEPPSPPSHHSSTGNPQVPCPQPYQSQLTVRQLRDIHTRACQQHSRAGIDVSKQGRAAGGELKPAPQTTFPGQTSPALALFRKNKTLSLNADDDDGRPWLSQRRASEPEAPQLAPHLERSHRRAVRHRLSSDTGVLKVSEVDAPGGQSAEPHLCLSPCAVKAVTDCCLSHHLRSGPQSGQPLAMSLVESRRVWLRRCTDPMAPEPDSQDLEQIFAEESFV